MNMVVDMVARASACDRPLAALLRALARGPAAPFRIAAARSVPWHSATFSGARHEVTLLLDGDDARDRAAALRDGLAEMEFALPGHIVADVAVLRASDATLAFAALTIEER